MSTATRELGMNLYGEDAPIVDGAASPAPFLLSAALGAVALFC